MRGLLLLALVLAGLISACGTGNPPTTATPRNPPTLPAPTWTVGEAANTPITLANISALRYLGRLDPPDTIGTWFDFSLSPDSTALAALNIDQLASWDLLTGQPLFYTGRGSATRIFYSPDKTELYGVSDTGSVGVFDAFTGAQSTTFAGHTSYSGVAAFYADAGWLALGGSDGTVKVWDTFERVSQVTLTAPAEAITTLAFSPDGSRLASAALDGTVRVWEWSARQEIASTKLDIVGAVTLLTFSPDGTRLAIGTNGSARLWQLDTAAAPVTMDSGRADILLFNGDGRYLLTGASNRGLSLWDGASATFVGNLPDTAGDGISAAFSPDGSLLVTATLDGGVFLWDLTDITSETLNQAALEVGTRQIHRVYWTGDGRLLLFFDAVGAVYVWGIGA